MAGTLAERARGRGNRGRNLGLATLVAITGYLVCGPVAFLLWFAFTDSGHLSIGGFERAFAAQSITSLFLNSFVFSISSALAATVVGGALAYLAARTDVPFRSMVYLAGVVPLIIPGLLNTIAWILLANPTNGLVNVAAKGLFHHSLVDVYSMPGMIFVQAIHSSPLAFLLIYAGLRAADPTLEDAAAICGAGFLQRMRRVNLPLLRPVLWGTLIILTVFGFESFEVPTLIGAHSRIWMFPTRIWQSLALYPADYGAAAAYALILLAIAVVALLLQGSTRGGTERLETVHGKGYRSVANSLGRLRWLVCAGVMVYFAVVVVAPVLTLIYISTQPYYAAFTLESLSRTTLDAYAEVLQDRLAMSSLLNSVLLGVGAATIVMAGMSVVSWMITRWKTRLRFLLEVLTFAPLTVPGIVLGVSVLFIYLRLPLPIYGTLWIILIAYVTKYMPYGVRYASASMYAIHHELEEGAEVAGGSWGQRFRRIVLPLLLPGLMTGWTYVFMLSVRELSSSVLLYSPGTEVVAVRIFHGWQSGQIQDVTALGVLLTLLMAAAGAAVFGLGRRSGVREQ